MRRGKGQCCLLFCALSGLLCGRTDAQELYRPLAADYRPAYERDAANRRVQGWDGGDGYWFWVQAFYNGYTKRVLGISVFHQAGWLQTCREMEARVHDSTARASLCAHLNVLGRTLSADWAKDDAHERINTNDLRRWGQRTRDAAAREDGSGREIAAAVASVQAEADRRLVGGK